jgi:hypothetical protein
MLYIYQPHRDYFPFNFRGKPCYFDSPGIQNENPGKILIEMALAVQTVKIRES